MRRTNNHHWPSIIIAKYHGNEERQPGSMGRKRTCFVGERREQIHAIQTNIDIDTAPISTINRCERDGTVHSGPPMKCQRKKKKPRFCVTSLMIYKITFWPPMRADPRVRFNNNRRSLALILEATATIRGVETWTLPTISKATTVLTLPYVGIGRRLC